MDSALCTHYGALPLPSIKSLTKVPRLRSDFSPSSLSLSSNGCTYRTSRGYAFSPVVTAINKCSTPSTNGKEDKRLMQRSIGGASLVLACVLGIMNCNYKFTPRAIAAPRESHRRAQSSDQQDILFPKTAKDVLESLLMVNVNVASRPPAPSRWKKFHKKLKLPPTFSMQDCEELKINAAALIKAGKSDEAEKQLQEIYSSLVTQGGGKISESAYNVQMALVAILMFQGKYSEAAKCDCLKKGYAIPSDGRVHLYKAIIHTMLDENKEAKECWETFVGFLDNEDMLNPSPSRSRHKHKVF